MALRAKSGSQSSKFGATVTMSFLYLITFCIKTLTSAISLLPEIKYRLQITTLPCTALLMCLAKYLVTLDLLGYPEENYRTYHAFHSSKSYYIICLFWHLTSAFQLHLLICRKVQIDILREVKLFKILVSVRIGSTIFIVTIFLSWRL